MLPRLNLIATRVCVASILVAWAGQTSADEFDSQVKPLVKRLCMRCHSGDDANADIDFATFRTRQDVMRRFEVWDSAVENVKSRAMPPSDEPQPTDAERKRIVDWFEQVAASIEPRPAPYRPRRLSVHEYRNTLETVLGFPLHVAIIEAEQTLAEKSLVVKLLPVDPPGQSGFTNDTHNNPLTTVVWDQYAYLVDVGLQKLFSADQKAALEKLAGPLGDEGLTPEHAKRFLRSFIRRAWRRDIPREQLEQYEGRLGGLSGPELAGALRFELKTILMSPRFLYRGLLQRQESGRRTVDAFELAERLSYFLWADMPDEQLLAAAANDSLLQQRVLREQLDRMLAHSKARNLAEDFAVQWLTLKEIEHVSNNPPQMVALKSQPVDFMHYLFTQDRPLLELIDSRTAFISPHTSRLYGEDARQMEKYRKQKGIEIEIVANQQIRLNKTEERGGILTMPGVLAMNRGPILRGVWMLERILGDELPEPPPDVGQVPPSPRGESLTFRQRFEKHRSNPACAVCHDKIDPLGFALQTYDGGGRFIHQPQRKPPKKRKGGAAYEDAKDRIDTRGKLPSGETFADVNELKQILKTTQKTKVIRNIVEKTMSYALCRKLTIYDRPTVDELTNRMTQTNGTWRQLLHAIVATPSFRETIFP